MYNNLSYTENYLELLIIALQTNAFEDEYNSLGRQVGLPVQVSVHVKIKLNNNFRLKGLNFLVVSIRQIEYFCLCKTHAVVAIRR